MAFLFPAVIFNYVRSMKLLFLSQLFPLFCTVVMVMFSRKDVLSILSGSSNRIVKMESIKAPSCGGLGGS